MPHTTVVTTVKVIKELNVYKVRKDLPGEMIQVGTIRSDTNIIVASRDQSRPFYMAYLFETIRDFTPIITVVGGEAMFWYVLSTDINRENLSYEL